MKLYVYYITDDFETDEQEIRYEAVTNNKDLKAWSESHYIGKVKSFIANGKEIVADETIDKFIDYYFKECVCINSNSEYAGINIDYIGTEYTRENALEELVENLDYENSEYAERIFNSNNLFTETEIILDEIMIDFLNEAIQKLHKRIKNIKCGN